MTILRERTGQKKEKGEQVKPSKMLIDSLLRIILAGEGETNEKKALDHLPSATLYKYLIDNIIGCNHNIDLAEVKKQIQLRQEKLNYK